LQSHFRKELQDSIEVCNQTYFGKLLHNIREDKSRSERCFFCLCR
jgi:hypothetical protein